MCNCRDQNTNKNMKLQIWSFEKWNFKYRVSLLETFWSSFLESKKLLIWSYRISFGDGLITNIFNYITLVISSFKYIFILYSHQCIPLDSRKEVYHMHIFYFIFLKKQHNSYWWWYWQFYICGNFLQDKGARVV